MTAPSVTCELDAGVAVLTLDEPERRNPLSRGMVDELTSALRDLEATADCRAVVLTGAGRGFCSGADLRRMGETSLWDDRTEYGSILRLNELVWGYPKPTVASVHGFALGGGCSLMAWCDFVVVEEGTRLGFPEVRAGLPAAAVVPTLMRVVGRRATMELVLTGDEVSPARAVEMGLVNRLVERGRALPTSIALASRIAAHSGLATRLTKEIVATTADMAYEHGVRYAMEVRVIGRAARDAGDAGE